MDTAEIVFIKSTRDGVDIEYIINDNELENYTIPSDECSECLCQLMNRLDEGNDILSMYIKDSGRMIRLEIRNHNILKLMEALYVHKYSKFHHMLHR